MQKLIFDYADEKSFEDIEFKENKFVERYKIHQYWSRKPWYIVRNYIKEYSKKNDIVLDPFVGGGATAFEALACHRNVIARDLNPTSILITEVITEKDIDLKYFGDLYDSLMKQISPIIFQLYDTECRNCHNKIEFINSIWNNDVLTHLFIDCKHCKYHGIVQSLDLDFSKINEIERIEIKKWYPKDVLLPKDADVKFVHELYTKRNLIALSELYNLIENIPEGKYKKLFLLMFISTSTRTIKSIFVNKYRFSKGINPAGVWGEKRFWVPNEFVENNVLYYFKERLDKIIKAKEETNSILHNTSAIADLKIAPAQNLKGIENESIDYIFTDPPYAGAIKYLDLSTVWNAWLGQRVIKEKEIVSNNGNNYSYFIQEIKTCLSEIFRVLKPNKFLSICFHFSNLLIWKEILLTLNSFHYTLEKIEIIEPTKKSHNQITINGTVDTDAIITIKKILCQKEEHVKVNINVSDLIKEFINKLDRNKTYSTAELYDKTLLELADNILNLDRNIVLDILNINELSLFLDKIKLVKSIETQYDYKGMPRELLKWKVNNV